MKKAFKSCKQDAKSILKLLRPHSMTIDVEFVIVAEVLAKLLQTSITFPKLEDHESPELSSSILKLSELAAAYLQSLERLQRDQQALVRNLQSPRLNHALALRNALIFQTLSKVIDAISPSTISSVPTSSRGEKKGVTKPSMLQTALGAFASDLALDDPAAAIFWLKYWPKDDFLVGWPQFQASLLSEFPTVSLKALNALHYFLDFSHTSTVSKPRLNAFLKICPSFGEMIPFAAELLDKRWFHGYLTKSEASALLQQEPVNSFIIRINKSPRATLACSYSTPNRGGVTHHVIQKDHDGLYSMLNYEGTFASIDQLIEQSTFLKHELQQTWVRSAYFLGEATKEEAEAFLDGMNEGAYVVRLCSSSAAALGQNSLLSSSPVISPPNSPHPPHPTSPHSGSFSGALPSSPIAAPTTLSALHDSSPGSTGSISRQRNGSSPTASWRDMGFMVAVMKSGIIRHTILPRDLHGGSLLVHGKAYSDVISYLDANHKVYVVPFSPSSTRFRNQLDAPSGSSSPGPASMRFSASLTLSGSGTSLSSSMGIPRAKTTDDEDNQDNADAISTPAISQDDLSLHLGLVNSDSGIIDNEVPVIDISVLNLTPPKKKSQWKPLTDSQVNPKSITYRDMWAELLRYYHVPVPEAKIPPK